MKVVSVRNCWSHPSNLLICGILGVNEDNLLTVPLLRVPDERMLLNSSTKNCIVVVKFRMFSSIARNRWATKRRISVTQE